MSQYIGKVIIEDWAYDRRNGPQSWDKSLVLSRMCSDRLLEPEICSNDIVPSCSALNVRLSDEPKHHTLIGYCPILPSTPTDPSTVFTSMKNPQMMMSALQQEHLVLTADLAIYCIAKDVQLSKSEEFEKMVVRLGGFPIALNFFGVIGKAFVGSGLE